MRLLDNPIRYQYISGNDDIVQFIIDPTASERLNTLVYNQFINGLYIGAQYSQIEISQLIDNGYKWIVTY